MLIAKHNCGQQEEPATLFSRLLLRMPGTYKAASLVWTSTKNEWNAQDAICTRSRVFWPSITWTLHKARCWCKEGCKSVLTFDRCRSHSVTFGYYHLKYVAVFRAEPFRVRTDLWMRNSRPFSDFFKRIISFSGNIRQTREQGFSQDDTNFSTEAQYHLRGMAQPYHPGSGSHGHLLRPHQHGIAPGERSHLRSSTPPLTARRVQKHSVTRPLHHRQVVAVGWDALNSSPMACVWRWDTLEMYSNHRAMRRWDSSE